MGIKIPLEVPESCPHCEYPTQENNPFCMRCDFDLRHQSFNKERGECIYCGAVGELSKEHVFGKWLARNYPFKSRKPMIQTLRRPEKVEIFPDTEPVLHVRNLRPEKAGSYQTKVRNVCAGCNNGWMSKLHKKAMSLVKSLADGQWTKLTPDEFELLSRWVVMVSVNLECHAHMLSTNKAHLTSLMNGKVPAGWRVYIGLQSTDKHANFNHTRVIPMSIQMGTGADPHPRFKNTVFCIEHAMFNTMSVSVGGDVLLELSKYDVVSQQRPHPLTCIWSAGPKTSETINLVDDSIIDYFLNLY